MFHAKLTVPQGGGYYWGSEYHMEILRVNTTGITGGTKGGVPQEIPQESNMLSFVTYLSSIKLIKAWESCG